MTLTQTDSLETNGRRERLVETTLDLLAFETQNHPGETRQAFDWLERRVTDLGIDFERIEAERDKPNVVATIPGKREWTLLYEGHLDTVPYDRDCWSRDPLGERVDDRLYGRGATDMKGAVAAMLETMRTFADQPPPVTLQFAFVSDEETGGEAGIDAVLDTEAIAADAAVVGETTTVDDEYAIAVADKGRLWVTLEATGRAAHGSRPMCGENAVDRLYSVVADCRESMTSDRLSYPEPVGRIVDESVAYYEHRYPDERLTPRTLFEYPTVNLGRLVGGSTVNSVPQSATAEIDIRITPGISASEILDELRACIAVKDGVEIADVSSESGTYVDPDHQFVDAVSDVGRELADRRVSRYCATGGGDAKKLRAASVPAVECAVGSDTAHAVDEHVSIEALERTAEWYRRLPDRLGESIGSLR